MKPYRRFFFFAFFPIFFFALGGAVMWLWNSILPSVIHVGTLTYWQALGLLVLCRILFGSFHFRGNTPPFAKNRWGKYNEKWASMSDEDKQKMRERWKQHCEKK